MEALGNARYGSWRPLNNLTQSFRACHLCDLCRVRLLQFCVLSLIFVYSVFLLLFAAIISHTLLKFNVQFNVLWNILVYDFLTPTQLLIYSSDPWADKRCCHSICLPYTLAQPFIFSYYGCQDNYMLQLLLMDPQLSVKHWLIEPWYNYHKEYSFEMNCL